MCPTIKRPKKYNALALQVVKTYGRLYDNIIMPFENSNENA